MAGKMQRHSLKPANLKPIAILEQAVEFRAIASELGAFVENLAEYVLDVNDLATDRERAAELVLKIRRGRKVVGVSVRF